MSQGMRERFVRKARGCLAAAFFLAFGLGGLVIGCVCFPLLAFFPQRRMRALVRASYRLFVWLARVTGLFRVALSPADRARLAQTHGRVIVANHLTLIDIVILIAFLPDSTSIAKAAAKRKTTILHARSTRPSASWLRASISSSSPKGRARPPTRRPASSVAAPRR